MSKQKEALKLLDDLDSFTPIAPPAGSKVAGDAADANVGQAAEDLAYLNELAQTTSKTAAGPPINAATAATLGANTSRPSSRASTGRIRVGTPTSRKGGEITGTSKGATAAPAQAAAQPAAQTSGGWGGGWGSVWSSASAALQQARTVVDEQVKNLPSNLPMKVPDNEQTKKWKDDVMGYVKQAQLDKLSQDFRAASLSRLTDILNVVAPPIAEHEVIQVWLSHDMEGYEGTESLVFRSLSTILQQVNAGDLAVKSADKRRRSTDEQSVPAARRLNTVQGLEPALKLAQASLKELIKINEEVLTKDALPSPDPSSTMNPVLRSHVFLRIQPLYSTSPIPSAGPGEQPQQFQFLLHLSDPTGTIVHTTLTQALPARWIDMWDEHEWVEDTVVEALRVGIEVIGQEYVTSRMSWGKMNNEDLEKAAVSQKAVAGQEESEEESEEEEDEEEESEEEEQAKPAPPKRRV